MNPLKQIFYFKKSAVNVFSLFYSFLNEIFLAHLIVRLQYIIRLH